MSEWHFPADFRWGFATASYQIEGGHDEDGKGESIWDRLSHTPGGIETGEVGDVACDHYHRYEADLDLMASLNVNTYRFSMSWPRILPDGKGDVNAAGVAFYDRLIDGMLGRGIRPFCTLFHWDLPQALEDRGGWPERATVDAFERYVDVVATAFGDRVKDWTTINEPSVVSFNGHTGTGYAPARNNIDDALAASHHVLLAHARAVPIIKAIPGAEVGISPCLFPMEHVTPEGAEAALDRDAMINRWFLDPLAGRGYPERGLRAYGRSDMPAIRDGDLDAIAAPIDFLGVNYYFPMVVDGRSDRPRTDFDWEIYPHGMRIMVERLEREYDFPSYYISENGAYFDDVVEPDGAIHDSKRVAFLRDHFTMAQNLIAEGVPIKGYFVWTFMDNFEWIHGTAKRFGVVRTDFDTLERIPKDSAQFCASVFGAAKVPTP
jgi:beta-glucosidase